MEKSNYFFGLTRYWWIPLLTGLIFIGFGVWCLCDPAPSLSILAYIFAGFIGLIGVFNLFYGFININSYYGWGWAVAAGIVEILFSIFLFFIPTPELTIVFTYGVGLYIIFMAIYSFVDSLMMTRFSAGWLVWLILFLLAALVFSLIFILGPIGGAVLGWLYIGISFICYGIFRMLLSCKLHQINRQLANDNR